MIVNNNAVNQKVALLQGNPTFLSASLLNKGINRITRAMEKINQTNATKADSLRNCLINWYLSDPTVLRIPTSLALFSLRAVDRFMKLIQASISTNTPIIANSQTNCIRPPS